MPRDIRLANREYNMRFKLFSKAITNTGRLVKGKVEDVFYCKQSGDKIFTKNATVVARFQDANLVIETADSCDFQEDKFVEDIYGNVYRITAIYTLENQNHDAERMSIRPVQIRRLALVS